MAVVIQGVFIGYAHEYFLGDRLDAEEISVATMTSAPMTIGQLAKQFGLSRSTLLYYDSIGLLQPSWRSRANYRRYTQEDCNRLQLICMYRQVGLLYGVNP